MSHALKSTWDRSNALSSCRRSSLLPTGRTGIGRLTPRCDLSAGIRSGVTNAATLALIFSFLFVVPIFIGYRTGHLMIAISIATLATAGVYFWIWSSIAETETLKAIVAADGNELVLSYYGGDCEDQRSVSIDEEKDAVRVLVKSRSFASECNDMAILRQVSVRLDRPLGARAVIDRGCTKDRRGCERTLSPLPQK